MLDGNRVSLIGHIRLDGNKISLLCHIRLEGNNVSLISHPRLDGNKGFHFYKKTVANSTFHSVTQV